jgi:hypothetical protein
MIGKGDTDNYVLAIQYSKASTAQKIRSLVKKHSNVVIDEENKPSMSMYLGINGLDFVQAIGSDVTMDGGSVLWIQRIGVGYIYVDIRVLYTWDSLRRLDYDRTIDRIKDGLTIMERLLHRNFRADLWMCVTYSVAISGEICVFLTQNPYEYSAKYNFKRVVGGYSEGRWLGEGQGLVLFNYDCQELGCEKFKLGVNSSTLQIFIVSSLAQAKEKGCDKILGDWMVYDGVKSIKSESGSTFEISDGGVFKLNNIKPK